MNDCYYEKKDWRVCAKEVSCWAPTTLAAEYFLRRNADNLVDGGFSTMLEAKRQ